MGRGSSKAGGGRNERQKENQLQFEEAIHFGRTRGAGSVEYTDSEGNVHKEKIKDEGGVYKASFNPKIEQYNKMTEAELTTELKKQQSISDENYMKFARSAASKSGSQVKSFAKADEEIRAIKQVIRRKKKGK